MPLVYRLALSVLPLALLVSCDKSEEMRLRSEVQELHGQLTDARQRAEDIKVRMQQIRARNKVLIGLVEGLTAEPGKAGDDTEAGVPSAHRALEALDRDIAVLATTLKQSREDMVQLRSQRKALQTNLDEAMRTIEESKQREAAARERLDTYRGMLLRLRTMIESEKLELQIVRNRMVVKLPEALLFETGKAAIKQKGRDALARLAPILMGIEGREFEIAGHTDDVPIHNWRFRSNWDLAAARAVTVARFLIEQGVPRERLSAASYAATRPLSTEDSDEARAMNRRIEIALLPKLDELPDLSTLDEATEGELETEDATDEIGDTPGASTAAAPEAAVPPAATPAATTPPAAPPADVTAAPPSAESAAPTPTATAVPEHAAPPPTKASPSSKADTPAQPSPSPNPPARQPAPPVTPDKAEATPAPAEPAPVKPAP